MRRMPSGLVTSCNNFRLDLTFVVWYNKGVEEAISPPRQETETNIMKILNTKIADIKTLHGIACALPIAARYGDGGQAMVAALYDQALVIGGAADRLARIKRMVNKINRGVTEADLQAMAATWRKHQMINGNIL